MRDSKKLCNTFAKIIKGGYFNIKNDKLTIKNANIIDDKGKSLEETINNLYNAIEHLQPEGLKELKTKVETLESLVSEGDNPTAAIDKFNEIVAFLANFENTQTLDDILTTIKQNLATKANIATTLAGYGITDGYTKTEGQALEDSIDGRLDTQDAAIALLNGNEVIVVDDHTQVTSPNSQKIYREQGSTSYTDWMYQDNAWKEIATYSFPGVDDEPTPGSDNLIKSGGVLQTGILNKKIYPDSIFLGAINYTDGVIGSNPQRAYSIDFFNVEFIYYIIVSNPTIKFSIRCYDNDKVYIPTTYSRQWINKDTKIIDIISDDTKFIRLVFGCTDNRNLNTSDIDVFSNGVYFKVSVAAIEEINESIDNKTETTASHILNIGSISSVLPYEDNNDVTNRVKTDGYVKLFNNLSIQIKEGQKASIRVYDTNKNGLYSSNFFEGRIDISRLILKNNISGASYIRFVLAYTDDRDVSDVSDFYSTALFTPNVGSVYSEEKGNYFRVDSRVNYSDEIKNNALHNIGIYGIVDTPQKGSKALVTADGIFNAVNDFKNTLFAFEKGNITLQGADEVSDLRCRTIGYIKVEPHQYLHIEPGLTVALRAYSVENTGGFISYDYTWITTDINNIIEILPSNAVFYRIVVKKTNNSNLTPDEAKSGVYITLNKKEDNKFVTIDGDYVIQKHINKNDGSIASYDYIGFTNNFYKIADIYSFNIYGDFLITLRYYDKDFNFISVNNAWTTSTDIADVTNAVYIRICVKYADEHALHTYDADVLRSHIYIVYNLDIKTAIVDNTKEIEKQIAYSSVKSIGNVCIHCAKEHIYNDGSYPVTEWFLLEEPDTNCFYFSKDLRNKYYLFTFAGNSSNYEWGILSNGDIIAVRLASTLDSTSPQSDSKRENPFVFKASENWAVQHEVDFGTSIKPCGWLENSGFTNLPNGDAMFGEYTRPFVETCNVWKISGDPLDASNWIVKKTFSPIGGDGDQMYKHIHCITVDFYTGVVYCTTGDEDAYAQIWYTLDGGETWTEIPKNESLNNGQQYRLLQMTFTPDYIYWATDTPGNNRHVVYRTARDSNGIFDKTQVELFCNLTPQEGNYSSYGQAYIPEYNCIFVYDRQDGGGTQSIKMPLRVIELDTGEIKTIGYLDAAASSTNIGFRTRYSEWYPIGGVCRVGFGFDSYTFNRNKGFGNGAYSSNPSRNINNLVVHITKCGNHYNCRITTSYC